MNITFSFGICFGGHTHQFYFYSLPNYIHGMESIWITMMPNTHYAYEHLKAHTRQKRLYTQFCALSRPDEYSSLKMRQANKRKRKSGEKKNSLPFFDGNTHTHREREGEKNKQCNVQPNEAEKITCGQTFAFSK